PVERLARDFGLCRSPDIMEVTAQMRPAGSLAELALPLQIGGIEFGIALVAIGLKNAAGLAHEARDLVDDARSLAAWFCLHVRPDIDWSAWRPSSTIAPTSSHETPPGAHLVGARETARQVPATGLVTGTGPRVRSPKTRI